MTQPPAIVAGDQHLYLAMQGSKWSHLPEDFELLRRYVPRNWTTGAIPKKLLAGLRENNLPWVYTTQNTSVLLCLNAKAGSTAWLHLLSRAKGLKAWNSSEIHKAMTSLPDRSKSPDVVLNDPHVLRIAMVRNPYSRLLSGYLDKILPHPHEKYWGSAFTLPGLSYRRRHNFSDFVQLLTHHIPANASGERHEACTPVASSYGSCQMIRHFALQSNNCKLPNDGQHHAAYDLALPIEEMAVWYEPLARLLGLQEAAQAVTGQNWTSVTGAPCFYAAPGRACDQMFAPHDQRGVVRGAAHSTALAASHRVINAQEADSKLRSYYTAALAQQVTEWARADLGAFGYAEWSPIMQMR